MDRLDKGIASKYRELKNKLNGYGKVAVAFSGGVDSTFLLYSAVDTLGAENVIAVTAQSLLFPKSEYDEAKQFCEEINVKQLFAVVNPFDIEGFENNNPDRCYLCKKTIFTQIGSIANSNGIDFVAEGSNTDDDGDYRPGHIAIRELGVKSPLKECGIFKEEIRIMSKAFGLKTFSKPAYACLASRVPYGELITPQKLIMVEKAEQYLRDNGFLQQRVRVHGTVARIELLPEDIGKFMNEDMRSRVYDQFLEYGFNYVSLDLKGYRTGSLNEVLKEEDKLK